MNDRILIIEDDQAILKLLQRGLAYEGYLVDVATDGRAGLNLARDHTPDLTGASLRRPALPAQRSAGSRRGGRGRYQIRGFMAKPCAGRGRGVCPRAWPAPGGPESDVSRYRNRQAGRVR